MTSRPELYLLTVASLLLPCLIGCGRIIEAAPSDAKQVLSLNPSTLELQANQPAPLTAVTTSASGAIQDVTQQVAWQTSSSDLVVDKGTAVCKQAGDYTVTANTAALSASASVHCVPLDILKKVKGLQFLTPPAAIPSNAPTALTVQAIYNDGSVEDVTSKASWNGDKVAHISTQGVASCNGAGTANISATFGSATATIQVPCFMKHRTSHAGFVEHSAVFYGPFPSWLNLITDFHAVGDGVADDTAALRAGLVAAAQQRKVLYVPNPPVVYRLTDTLHLKGLDGITITGQDPKLSRILWTGAAQGTMLSYEGSSHIKISRLFLDGNNGIGGAAVILDHDQNDSTQLYPTYDLMQDLTVSYFQAGIVAKFAGETSVNRVHFDHLGTGVALENFNALNFNVTECLFTDNAINLSNEPGAGAFNASHNVFVRTSYADMLIGNTAAFSIRYNLSVDSQAFFVTRGSGAAAVITAEGNVIRGMKSVPFQFSDPSVLLLVGNTFEAPVDPQQSILKSQGTIPMQVFSMDNLYSSPHPFEGNLGTVQSIDEQPQANVSVSAIQVPNDAYLPPSSVKPVIEIPVQATAATIQQIVNDAAALSSGAVVHFAGVSVTTATINVPNAPELALVGDGMLSYLVDGGLPQGNPVLRTHGAVQIEDLLIGASPTSLGIQVLVDDQPSSRILCDDCTTLGNTNVGVSVAGLDNAKVNFRSSQINGSYGFTVRGGVNQGAGSNGLSSVDAFMTTSNTFTVGNMGHFLISDGFHDGGQPAVVGKITDGAVVTYDGGIINSASGLFLNGFSGVMSLLGVQVDVPIVADNASSGMLGLVGTLNVNTSINVGTNTQLSQTLAYSTVETTAGLTPLPLVAGTTGDIERLLAQARTEDVLPREKSAVAAQVVHMRHVAVASGAVAFSIGPNPGVASATTYVIADPSNTADHVSSCAGGAVSLTGTWTLDPGNDGFYGLKGQFGYLGNMLPSGGGQGALVFTSQMTDAGQRWLIEPTGDGTFTITNRADGTVLTRMTAGCAASGVADGSLGQRWMVTAGTM